MRRKCTLGGVPGPGTTTWVYPPLHHPGTHHPTVTTRHLHAGVAHWAELPQFPEGEGGLWAELPSVPWRRRRSLGRVTLSSLGEEEVSGQSYPQFSREEEVSGQSYRTLL